MLIRAHALLHQTKRQKDSDGRVIAEIADYAVVRHLVADLVAEGAEATVKPEIREVVKAVTDLIARRARGGDAVGAAAGRAARQVSGVPSCCRCHRCRSATQSEDRKAGRRRLVLGDPLPDDFESSPDRSGCAVARLLQG